MATHGLVDRNSGTGWLTHKVVDADPSARWPIHKRVDALSCTRLATHKVVDALSCTRLATHEVVDATNPRGRPFPEPGSAYNTTHRAVCTRATAPPNEVHRLMASGGRVGSAHVRRDGRSARSEGQSVSRQ